MIEPLFEHRGHSVNSMASSLLLLLDDIAGVLDDVATMTKVAATKTAAVVGDDLALNARQIVGVGPDRELAVVVAVARGSAINKAILVPAALAVSQFAPWAVTPLLMAGGAYLCYEGVEKILHHGQGRRHAGDVGHPPHVAPSEGDKIAGAIRTDFILSAEIIVITLGVVAGRPLLTQLAVLAAIAAGMTVGVYGLVAGIVKLDDLGARLAAGRSGPGRVLGRSIVVAAPWLMRALSIAGTAAMFLVGGGIVAHGLPAVHDALHAWAARLAAGSAGLGGTWWSAPLDMLANGAVGVVVGAIAAGLAGIGRRAMKRELA
jgi:predicted DNA repair protein MutK